MGERKIGLLHGCNLNMLGKRDPEHYGTLTLEELEGEVAAAAKSHGLGCVAFQTNHEGDLIEKIHEMRETIGGLIINPGAWTHYSYGIHDALELVEAPVAEVHLSNIASRKEEWRHRSVISDVCGITISGEGVEGYLEAVEWLAEKII